MAAGAAKAHRPDSAVTCRKARARCTATDRTLTTIRAPGANSGRRPPRHRQTAPRAGDLAGLGAAFGLCADLAGIKRRRSTGGSPFRGLAMARLMSALVMRAGN